MQIVLGKLLGLTESARRGATTTGLLVLLVPGIEGLLGIGLVLKDAQQVAVAEGIDGLATRGPDVIRILWVPQSV